MKLLNAPEWTNARDDKHEQLPHECQGPRMGLLELTECIIAAKLASINFVSTIKCILQLLDFMNPRCCSFVVLDS